MSTAAGVWLITLLIILAFMAIKNQDSKPKPEPQQRPFVPPVIPRPRPTQPAQSPEQRFARLQADYQRKLSLLQHAIPDFAHRRLAEQELYSRYLNQIKEWLA